MSAIYGLLLSIFVFRDYDIGFLDVKMRLTYGDFVVVIATLFASIIKYKAHHNSRYFCMAGTERHYH